MESSSWPLCLNGSTLKLKHKNEKNMKKKCHLRDVCVGREANSHIYITVSYVLEHAHNGR